MNTFPRYCINYNRPLLLDGICISIMDISIFNVSYLHSNVYLLAFIMISCTSIIYIHLRSDDIHRERGEYSLVLCGLHLMIYFPRTRVMNVKTLCERVEILLAVVRIRLSVRVSLRNQRMK